MDTKPTPGLAATSGVVASIEGLTKGLAVDLAPAGVRVNLVGPGAVGIFALYCYCDVAHDRNII